MYKQYRGSVDADVLLADLDADQRRAVTTDSRLVAVIAGAGSGKTRVLTRRVAYRVAIGTADPTHTLVLTFTREAAGELRRRLPRLGLEQRVTAGTFHSVCRQLLQQRWLDLGQKAPTLRTDRARILREALGGSGLDEIMVEVDLASSRGWSGAEFTARTQRGDHRSTVPPARVADALDKYAHAKQERNIIDLDDLLRLTVEQLENDPEFEALTQWKFRHILVDEAQDLNPLQHRLINAMRKGVDDLFLVGDPAQAIYGFTGSDPGLLLDVAKRFPGIEIVRLPVNHRSTPQVVAGGRYALERGDQPTDIEAERDDGRVVQVVAHNDEHIEAAAVAQRAKVADPHLLRLADVAVLGRTHAVLAPIREALLAAGVPVRHTVDGPGSNLAPHLREIYRFQNPNQIREWAQDHREEVDETGDQQLGAVVQAALDFLRERPTGIGTDFEAWVDLSNPFGEQTAGVELQTFHASKGREWHTVYVVGAETGLVPHRSSTNNKTRKLEEARLLYVAITRATDELVINWAERRGGYQRKISPLLDGFVSETATVVAPPAEIASRELPVREATLERLRTWRAGAARSADILPTQLVSDHMLTEIVDERPRSAVELDELTGIGRITASRLFPGIEAALVHQRTAEAS